MTKKVMLKLRLDVGQDPVVKEMFLMSKDKVQFTISDLEAARDSLAESIDRLSPSVQGWPKHILENGTAEQIVTFANYLCRPKTDA